MTLTPPLHPNLRKRRELRGPRHALIAVLVLVAIGALASLVGHRRALSPSASGLLIALAAVQAVAAVALATHRPPARMLALGAALFAALWGAWQVLALDYVTWFEIALMLTGVVEALFVTGCMPRDAGEPRRWRQRKAA